MNYSMKEQYGLGGICKALPVLAAGLLVSCVGGGDVTENPPSGRAGMPSNQEIFGYIKDITDFGPRRTGSEASVKASDYVAGSFKEFGLQRVTIETGDTSQWEARKWGLEVAGVTIPSFYMRHSFHPGKVAEFSTGPDGLNAQFVYVGNRKDLQGIDVQGKIVVADVELTEKSMGTYMTASTSVYDPNSTISANEKRIDPFTPNNYPFNFASAMEGGAVGFIGILANYFDSNKFYNEDLHYYINDDTVLSLPGLWVSRRDGETLKTILAQNPGTTGKLVLDGDVRKVQYRTVIGHLPGQSDETLMVQSHHDSGFMGAVEDASGVSEVLALAKYYGKQPASSRKRSMMFVTMDTHFTGYEAHVDLATKYLPRNGVNVVANVTIEHIAREMANKDGKQVMTGQVEPRLFITSPSLMELASEQIRKHDYRRSLVISTEKFKNDSAGLPTDVGPIQLITGFPVISLISAPGYLYDISDTLDKVAEDQLQPTANLVADLLDGLHTMSVEMLGRDQEKNPSGES